jgi:hypothetical protein
MPLQTCHQGFLVPDAADLFPRVGPAQINAMDVAFGETGHIWKTADASRRHLPKDCCSFFLN